MVFDFFFTYNLLLRYVSLLKTAMSEFHIVIPNVISVFMPSNYFSHFKIEVFLLWYESQYQYRLRTNRKKYITKILNVRYSPFKMFMLFSFDCHDLFSSLAENRFFLTSSILTAVYPPSTPLTSSPPPFPFGPTSFCFSIDNNQVAMTYSVY